MVRVAIKTNSGDVLSNGNVFAKALYTKMSHYRVLRSFGLFDR